MSTRVFTPAFRFEEAENPFSKSTRWIVDPFRDPSFKDLYVHTHTCIYRVFHTILRFSSFDLYPRLRLLVSVVAFFHSFAFLSFEKSDRSGGRGGAVMNQVWVSRLKTKFSFSNGGAGSQSLIAPTIFPFALSISGEFLFELRPRTVLYRNVISIPRGGRISIVNAFPTNLAASFSPANETRRETMQLRNIPLFFFFFFSKNPRTFLPPPPIS